MNDIYKKAKSELSRLFLGVSFNVDDGLEGFANNSDSADAVVLVRPARLRRVVCRDDISKLVSVILHILARDRWRHAQRSSPELGLFLAVRRLVHWNRSAGVGEVGLITASDTFHPRGRHEQAIVADLHSEPCRRVECDGNRRLTASGLSGGVEVTYATSRGRTWKVE